MLKSFQIKDLILTDYLDGRLQGKLKADMENHIESCANCRAFLKLAKENLAELFEGIVREKTPDEVWKNLRKSLIERQKVAYHKPVMALLEKIRRLIFIPKPAFAIASALSILLIAVILIRFNPLKQSGEFDAVNLGGESEQVQYLNYVMSYSYTSADSEVADYGTDMEKYFLN